MCQAARATRVPLETEQNNGMAHNKALLGVVLPGIILPQHWFASYFFTFKIGLFILTFLSDQLGTCFSICGEGSMSV